ncbi:hypothetical protein DEDE109153_10290 [Deinococcus deserti]
MQTELCRYWSRTEWCAAFPYSQSLVTGNFLRLILGMARQPQGYIFPGRVWCLLPLPSLGSAVMGQHASALGRIETRKTWKNVRRQSPRFHGGFVVMFGCRNLCTTDRNYIPASCTA